MSSGVTSRPAGLRSAGPEHLLAVREVLERARLDDAARDGVDPDSAWCELDGEVADERLERRLRGADQRVVLEHALRAEARDADDRRAVVHLSARRRARARAARARWPRASSPSACPRSRAPGGSRPWRRCGRARRADRAPRPARARGRRRRCRGRAPAPRRSARSSSAVASAAASERRYPIATREAPSVGEAERDRLPDPARATGHEDRRAVEGVMSVAAAARARARSSGSPPSRAASRDSVRRPRPSTRRARGRRAAASSPRRSGARGGRAGRSSISSRTRARSW